MGLVVDTFHGKDGVLKSVNVKISRGVLNRVVQKLHNVRGM